MKRPLSKSLECCLGAAIVIRAQHNVDHEYKSIRRMYVESALKASPLTPLHTFNAVKSLMNMLCGVGFFFVALSWCIVILNANRLSSELALAKGSPRSILNHKAGTTVGKQAICVS